MKRTVTVKCRQCGKPAKLDESNPWRPFCSQRCKLIDLGEWFSGGYAIPSDNPEEFPDADGGADTPPSRHQ